MIQGSLFTEEFLIEGIVSFPEWKSIKENELDKFKKQLENIFSKFPTDGNPNEDTTELDLIDPVLKELGWNHFLTEKIGCQALMFDFNSRPTLSLVSFYFQREE